MCELIKLNLTILNTRLINILAYICKIIIKKQKDIIFI